MAVAEDTELEALKETSSPSLDLLFVTKDEDDGLGDGKIGQTLAIPLPLSSVVALFFVDISNISEISTILRMLFRKVKFLPSNNRYFLRETPVDEYRFSSNIGGTRHA